MSDFLLQTAIEARALMMYRLYSSQQWFTKHMYKYYQSLI